MKKGMTPSFERTNTVISQKIPRLHSLALLMRRV
jgi:hypothetical protein